MGKPSTPQLPRKSNQSLITKSSKKKMNIPMSTCKMNNKVKRDHRKKKKQITTLFEKLRNESCTAFNNTNNNSVIFLDDSLQSPKNRKRKMLEISPNCKNKLKRTSSDSNFIIIKDDEEDVITNPQASNKLKSPKSAGNSSPIDSSTPKKNKNKRRARKMKSLILSNISISKNDTNIAEDINSLTKEINRDSYLTIDLTKETEKSCSNNSHYDTFIDLENMSSCTYFTASNSNLSMSGDSDVTVLNRAQSKESNERQIRKFADGISRLNASDKGRLLELITQKIFNGCNVPSNVKDTLSSVKQTTSRCTETAEDTFIREVILGQTQSRNSIGSNIYNPERDIKSKSGLRMIVIDGSNVAMEHGRGRMFSVKGLKICIDYFVKRGHIVKAFVPRFRCKFGKSSDPRLLDKLERLGLVVYTPSREIQGKLITSYDDRYIVQCAAEFDGIIVTGDNYRDLLKENPRWKYVIENRLLQFTWVNDMIMFPKDPLGRSGPTLEQFLKHPIQS